MFSTKNNDTAVWMNVSDLFAVLFLVFLLLSLLFVTASMETLEQLEKVEAEQQVVEAEIRKQLKAELQQELNYWQAEFIDSTLSIRFYSGGDKILFQQGADELEPHFQDVLRSFFPSYLMVLENDSISRYIHDIRIEGYTSSEGDYLSNMFLSQRRSNSVLQFLLQEVALSTYQYDWLLGLVSSNGLGSKHPIYLNDGLEDLDKSRRVEIKLVLKNTSP